MDIKWQKFIRGFYRGRQFDPEPEKLFRYDVTGLVISEKV
jgi:hypothetical protein